MKKMKKLASVALALVMALALMVPAFATQNEGDTTKSGKITIENATIGETYKVYKILDATYVGEGANAKAAYSIESTSPWYNLVNDKTDFFTLTQVGTSNTYNVAVKDDVTAAKVSEWIASITLPTPDLQATATETEVVFNGLGSGYFLVTSTLTNAEGASALITLTNAKPEATIVDKNQKPGGGDPDNNKKTVTEINDTAVTSNSGFSVAYGDTVTFEIRTTATNYDGEKQIVEYSIEDTMPDGMTLDETSVVVKVGDTTLTSDKYDVSDVDDNNAFTVTIPWVNTDGTSRYASPVVISITYDVDIDSDFEVNTANVNSAEVSYTDADGDKTTETKKLEETVYTYALAIKKVNKAGEPLENAKFTLAQGNDTLKFSKNGNVYTVNSNGSETEIVTDFNGLAIIKGVNGNAYTLTETEAPAGYNKLEGSQDVTPTLMTATTSTKWLDADGNVINDAEDATEDDVVVTVNAQAAPVVVVNFNGAVLPATGGMGTTIFYALGGVLLAGSAVLFVTKKRMGR